MTVEARGRRRLLSPLGLRLAAAFVVVAVAAVAVLAVLAVAAAREEVSSLVAEVHAADAEAAAAAASRAYEATDGWEGADLGSAVAVAARGQATLALVDADGTLVAAPADEAAEMLARMHGLAITDVPRGDPVTAPVVVDGEQVGTVALRFPTSHLPTPERQARDALARTILAGGVLAVAVAVVVAVFVARRVTAPVAALTEAATALEAGRRDVRVGSAGAPGELGLLSAAFDRMAEAVDREDRLRRQLVADVAHEVRTPLTILRATTEGLVDGVVPTDRETLVSLHDEVLRLADLVADLETLAAADAAGLHLDLGPVDLAEITAAALDAAAPVAAEHRLTVDKELAAAPTHADARRVHQIVASLLANAVRYTPDEGTITVHTGQTASGDSFVRVTDTGPGLSETDLDQVFHRFYRGSAATGTAGSGIGLAVALELATAHGGTLTASNAPEGGARFTLTVPAS